MKARVSVGLGAARRPREERILRRHPRVIQRGDVRAEALADDAALALLLHARSAGEAGHRDDVVAQILRQGRPR